MQSQSYIAGLEKATKVRFKEVIASLNHKALRAIPDATGIIFPAPPIFGRTISAFLASALLPVVVWVLFLRKRALLVPARVLSVLRFP
jgi:hypothetical protein